MNLDAHQHFWQYARAEYEWIDDTMPVLKANFLPPDLARQLAAHGLDGCIAVQARQTLQETAWLLSLADDFPFISGVVGWVDLQSQSVEAQLERFASHPKFVGVRHILQAEPNDRLMVTPDFMRGIAALERFGLTYDILIFPRHLPISAEFVAHFPNQPFVLDHLAKPFIAKGEVKPWATDLRALAQFPNVLCKLSGMVTEAVLNGWSREDFTPYIETALATFGAERLMFGSDWPVCRLSASYAEVVEIVKSHLSEAEQEAIFGRTAANFYGIAARETNANRNID